MLSPGAAQAGGFSRALEPACAVPSTGAGAARLDVSPRQPWHLMVGGTPVGDLAPTGALPVSRPPLFGWRGSNCPNRTADYRHCLPALILPIVNLEQRHDMRHP
jgi:hypothetical protein